MTHLKGKVREAVGKVQDPETGLTFAQMNMITNVEEREPGVFKIDFVPTSPFCPIAFKLAADIKAAALAVKGVKKALVYCHGHTMEEAINKSVNK
ncbi:MAG: iron-sulfur cluster assembly protein [Candidatus Bathyarchaeia archaeon]